MTEIFSATSVFLFLLQQVLQVVIACDAFQFIRIGYFCADPDGTADRPVFNRSVGLKDSWAKQVKKQ